MTLNLVHCKVPNNTWVIFKFSFSQFTDEVRRYAKSKWVDFAGQGEKEPFLCTSNTIIFESLWWIATKKIQYLVMDVG
jgi:hypothetical protein